MVESTPEQWVRLYRQGNRGVDVARLCGEDDVLAVLRHLTAAKAADSTLEREHLASLDSPGRAEDRKPAASLVLTPAWRRRLDELVSFVRDHGRMPRQSGGDEAETALGRWLHAQRGKVTKGTLELRQRAALDAVGAWDSDRRAGRDAKEFPARLVELIEFRAEHRRWPSYLARAGTVAEERALGVWLYRLREAALQGKLTEYTRGVLDRQVPGWNR
jgi:hypothetical protein